MDPATSERIEQLEASVAHLERLYDQLNQVVVEQAKTLARLITQQKQLSDTITQAELDRIRSTNAKPPHYQ